MNKIASVLRAPFRRTSVLSYFRALPRQSFSIGIPNYVCNIPLERKRLQGLVPLQDTKYGSAIVQQIYRLQPAALFAEHKLSKKDDITDFLMKTIDFINRVNMDRGKEMGVSEDTRSICAKLVAMDQSDVLINNFKKTLGILAAKQYIGGKLIKPNIKLLCWILAESSDRVIYTFMKALLDANVSEDSELERLAIIYLQIFDHPEIFMKQKQTLDLLSEHVFAIFEKNKADQSLAFAKFAFLKKILMGLFKVRPRDLLVRKMVLYLLMKDACEFDESFICTVFYIFCKQDVTKSFKSDVINVNPRLLEFMRTTLYKYGYREGADLYFSKDVVKIDKLIIFFEAFLLQLLDRHLDNDIVHLLYAIIESKNYSAEWVEKINNRLKNHLSHSNLTPQSDFILLYIFYMEPALDSDSQLSMFIFKTLLAHKKRFEVVTEVEQYMAFLTLRRYKHYFGKNQQTTEEDYNEDRIIIRSFYEGLYESFEKKIDKMDYVNFNRIVYELFYNLKTVDFDFYVKSPMPDKLWQEIGSKVTELSNFDFITVVYVLKKFFSINKAKREIWLTILGEIARRRPEYTEYQLKRMIIAVDNIKEFLNRSAKISRDDKTALLKKVSETEARLKAN